MSTYTKADARKCGALCDRCAFSKIHNAGMVGAEFAKGAAKAVIVGEAPGLEEVENDQPFVGKSGQLLMKALRASGVSRSQVTITNAVACRPPGNRMDTVKVKLRKWNKLLESQDKPPLLSPVAACRPRLMHDIRVSRTNNIVTVGGTALEGVTGVRQSILNVRGAPLAPLTDHPDFKIYPTLHPAFVLRMLRWRHVFQKDVARAFRWFDGRLGWKEPVTYFKPSFEQVDRFLSSKQKFFVVDTETDAKYPLNTHVRCVGISNEDVAIVIPLLSIDGITRFYSRAEEAKIRERLTQFFVDPTKLKVAHNAYYDKLVLWKAFGVFMAPILDTILLHRSVESEMPHSLGYVGSVFTDIDRAWKSEHTAVNAKSDRELWNYNALDVIITGRVVEPLKLLVAQRQQANVVRLDHEMQQVCADMHINGLRVDMKARDIWDKKLLHDAVLYRKVLREAIGRENFNPASVFQIRDLLFSEWELPIINETKAGDPSTDDDAIRALMLEPGLRKEQRRFLSALRMFRRRAKLRGTYIVKLMPKGRSYVLDDLTLDDIEDDLDESDYRDFREKDKKKEGIIDRDGRLRPGWNVHTPNTGRFSSGDPWNAQNVSRKLRNIIVPEEGHAFVYADKDQLELRLATTFSKAQVYLKVFAENGDPHSTSTLMVMGEAGRKIYEKAVAKYGDAKTARKKDEDWGRACDFGKCVTGDTLIAVIGVGLVPIRELVPTDMAPGESRPASIPVINASGENTEATEVYYGGPQPIYKLVLNSGIELKGTAKHQVMLENGIWKRLDAIVKGDQLRSGILTDQVLPVDYQQIPINPWVVKASPNAIRSVGARRSVDHTASGLPAITIDAKWGYLLGALHGDGCVSDRFVSLIGLPGDGVVDAVTKIYERIGINPNFTTRKARGKSQELKIVTAASIAFIDFLQRIGFASPKRDRTEIEKSKQVPRKVMRVPKVIFRSPKPVVVAYLAGVMDTDGSASSGGWDLTFKDEKFVADLQQLLLSLGIASRTTAKWNEQYQKNYYRLTLNRQAALSFAAQAGPYMQCRRKIVEHGAFSAAWKDKIYASTQNEVASIELVGEEEVFDLHVPNGNSFVANGLVNHNTFTYAALYGATIETIMEILRGAEDKDENLLYSSLNIAETQRAYDNWMSKAPEIAKWWEAEIALYRKQGFIEDRMTGRRCDFMDGEDRTQIPNYPNQSTGAGIVNTETKRVVQQFPRWKFGKYTGIIQQGHDALLLEAPLDKAEWTKELLNNSMRSKLPDPKYADMEFTASAKIIKHWGEA